MKNIVPVCILVSGIFLAGCAAHVVTRRPADVVYARSLSPGPGWVWVSGDWVWDGGRYQWREGYWHPPRPGYKWKRGYWEKDPDGYRWKRGRWQK